MGKGDRRNSQKMIRRKNRAAKQVRTGRKRAARGSARPDTTPSDAEPSPS